MRYEIHSPCERLRPYVRHLAISETDAAGDYPILPDTALVMGFQYAGKLAYRQDDSIHSLATAGITGLLDRYRLFQNHACTGSVLVVFREMGLAAFVRQPAHELFDLSVSLDHLFSRQAISDTQERLLEATGDRERLAAVEQFLLDELAGFEPNLREGFGPDTLKVFRPGPLAAFEPDPLVAAALHAIYRRGGNIRIGELARELHTSQSPLEKRFRRYVGASPKKFAGIVRARKMIAALERGRVHLDAQDYLDDYYDQAHFIKDFKRFTSLTPEAYLRGR
jgi:AraC-like DNA-binding protein